MILTDQLADLLRQVEDSVKHSKGCNVGVSLAVSHPHLAAYRIPCSCDYAERVRGRQGTVLAAIVGQTIAEVRSHSVDGWTPITADAALTTVLAAGHAALQEMTR
jgi:hypothetical protein